MNYIIVLMGLFLSFQASAYQMSCSQSGTRVIYTNGVDTDPKDARAALLKILALTEAAKSFDPAFSYKVAYNYDESIAKDVLEAAVQKIPQSYLDATKTKNEFEAYSLYKQGKYLEVLSEAAKAAIEAGRLKVLSEYPRDHMNYPTYFRTYSEMKEIYDSAVANNERIFAISHSQGSLFMNEMYEVLPENYKIKYFSGFQIASVSDVEIINHFGYATNSKDRVVNSVRILLGALPANLETPFYINNKGWDGDFFLNHGILSTYLYDGDLAPQVLTKLLNTANLLESNCL